MTSPAISPNNGGFNIVVGLVATVLFHAVIVFGYLISLTNGAEAGAEPESPAVPVVIVTDLALLGVEALSPSDLPEISNLPPEAVPVDEVSLDTRRDSEDVDSPRAQEQQDQARVEPETRSEQDVGRHNQHRPENDVRTSGSSSGVPDGISGPALQSLFWRTQRQIQRAFAPPASISSDELERLDGTIHIFVDASGRVIDYRWVRRSGNHLFDSALERAINTFRLGNHRLYLPADNEAVLGWVLEAGLEITVQP